MLIDASALVAILGNETQRDALEVAIADADHCVTTPIALYEAATGLARSKNLPLAEARVILSHYVRSLSIAVATIDDQSASFALDGFQRFGKGTGHPAKLNMGDCFAYAAAKRLNLPLLFVGDDFSQTDIASAL